ncbi:MAG: glycine oxidase ThiO, partial [Candidatus Sedimenticola sp. (ex Thyasira tokunagai)]
MPDHLIIGGGVIGMLTARELRLAGADVTLLERNTTGRESSWAGGGIISPLYPWRFPQPVTELARWSQCNYPELIEELLATTGIDSEWSRNGLLIISPEEQEEALRWGEESGSLIEVIDNTQLQECEPALSEPPSSALWMPEVAQVRNPRLVKALRQDLVQLGVSILEQQKVEQINVIRGKVTGVSTHSQTIQADSVIVCAGAWSGQLFAQLPSPPAVEPVKGQMILFKGEPGMISRITLEQDRYIIPRVDGRVLFGSTLEQKGFDKQTTQAAREELLTIARSRFPILETLPVEHHWAGLRPGSPGGIPYIGPHPEIEGLLLNTGQYRNGVVLGPASARLAVDILLQRLPFCPIEPYALGATRPEHPN